MTRRRRAKGIAGVCRALAALALAAASGCGREEAGPARAPATAKRGAPAAARAGDGLFLAEAPVVVPDELEPRLGEMRLARLYAAGATMSAAGKVTPALPPPARLKRPVVLVVMAEKGAAAPAEGTNGEVLGEAWGTGVLEAIREARSWADVEGVHIHLLPEAPALPVLAPALRAVKRITGLPLSITVSSAVALSPESLEPLVGAVDEILVLAYGRRPETGDRLVPELSEPAARDMPIPFRLLFVAGGYGFAGGTPEGRRVPDGEVDALSESRVLDFDFGQIFSAEPGSVYDFRPKTGVRASSTPFAAEGGRARFHILSSGDLVRVLGDVARWQKTPLLGRVFLVDGVPRDGRLVGFPVVEALLTGRPVEPRLELEISPGAATRSGSELSIVVSNAGPSPTDLSHFNNWVQLRVEGGVIANVKEGDFDRFALLSSTREDARPMSFGKAPVCRLYENLFAPGETNVAGPIRIAGARPRLFVSYQISHGGQPARGPEIEKTLAAPPAVRPASRRAR